eukprot:3971626-Amphidinium_carterae.1
MLSRNLLFDLWKVGWAIVAIQVHVVVDSVLDLRVEVLPITTYVDASQLDRLEECWCVVIADR